MANRYTVASGNASNPAVWDGGVSVPVQGDRVLISRRSTGKRTLSTNASGYAIGATAITLTGSVLAGSYVVGEAVQFGTDPNYYTITAWNNTTKVLTVSALIVAIPAAATVVVCCGHVVELDGDYTWGDDAGTTITINTLSTNRSVTVAGTLKFSRSVDSSLTGYGTISIIAGGGIEAGTIADPIPVGVTATIYSNRSAAMVLGKYNFEALPNCRVSLVGAVRKRWTTLTAAVAISDTSLQVADATGWQVGDVIHLASDNHGTPVAGYELLTIAAGYVSGALTVPLAAATTKTHRNGLPLGNLTTNVVFRSYSASLRGGVYFQVDGTEALNTRTINHVKFENITGSYPYQQGVSFSRVDQYLATPLVNPYASIDSCVFTNSSFVANASTVLDTSLGANPYYATQPVISNSLFAPSYILSNGFGQNGAQLGSQWAFDTCLLSAVGITAYSAFDAEVRNSWYVGCNTSSNFIQANNGSTNDVTHTNCTFSGTTNVLASSSWAITQHTYENCDIGYTYPLSIARAYSVQVGPSKLLVWMNNSKMAPRPLLTTEQTTNNLGPKAALRIRNRNSDVTLHEDYFATNTAVRDNAMFYRGTSSINIKPTTLLTDAVRSSKILCAAGGSIRVVGYVRADTAFYNGGGSNWTPPTVTISGLGITPVVFTASAAANNAWEQFDLTATNSSPSDGELTLSYTVNPKLVTTGSVYFDGVPEAPFVMKARHYGFTFDEASPVRTVNPVPLVSEATAIAYTGVTVTSTQITVGAGTVNTWAKLYAYMQAHACANLASTVNMTSSDGNNFALPLTYKLAWPGMGNDGTLVGGWLLLPSAGTYTHKLSGTKVDFTAAGTYDLSNCQFSGSVEFVNSSGGAVTVSIPSGFTPVNTGPSITLSAPVLTTTVAAQVSLAGAEIRIYDLDNSPAGSLGTELAGTESCPGSTFSLSIAASNNVWVQIMLAGYKEYGQQITGPAASTTFTVALTKELDA